MIQPICRLSVIIPYKDRKEYLKPFLKSLESQKCIEDEIRLIFVDNNSLSETHCIVEEWLRHKCPEKMRFLHLSEPDPGASAARNKGLMYADTEWVMFFDSDDEMPDTHLSSVQNAIKKNPDMDILYWDSILRYPSGKTVYKKSRFQHIEASVTIRSIWATHRYAVKRKFLNACGNWDSGLTGWDDWELAVRMLLRKPKVKFIKNVCPVIVNLHENSITGASFSSGEGQWEKAIDTALNHAGKTLDKKIISLINLKKAQLAADYKREGNQTASIKLIQELKDSGQFKGRIKIAYLIQLAIGKWSSAVAY